MEIKMNEGRLLPLIEHNDNERVKMNKERYLLLGFIGGTLFVTTVICLRDVLQNIRYIPRSEDVQQGYIAPSRLEITVDDLDRNGELETVLHVDKIPYLLREVEGKPVLSAYEIKPAEIIPKNY